jgi:regulator of PEP synthase PpsR (kinase-PPPase family)
LRPLSNKLFGLISSPRYLHQIRQERRPNSTYSSLEQCTFELGAAKTLFDSTHIPFIDTTTKSIEEIAAIILTTLGLTNSPEYGAASL